MSAANQAVFLSYAREDADAARRIADALRSHGVEVWFDQSELRGGDAWDAKIRQQINDCTLFLPIISKHTQERGKGYFRLEWKLAVEQTHLLADGMVFLAPVVVDETAESGALVPPEFLRVQWTRLPGALPTPQFVEQVKRLLEAPPKTGGPVSRPAVGSAHPPAKRGEASAPSKQPAIRSWMWAVTAALVLAAAGVFLLRQPAPNPATSGPTTLDPAAARPAPKDDKSIAVLPFTNMSEEKDSGFFADGVHEDILTNLAHIASLRVVSRTSVMEYRGKTENIRQIAEKLGVTYVLEGSVRRAGNKVRVTGQLINARTDVHVWAQSYDRDLSDTFAIQAELAREIASALSAALSPEEKARLGRPRTTNPAAYDLLLRARQIDRDGNDTRQELETEETLLQSAVTLDPAFASAWANLSTTHAQLIFNGLDTSPERLAKARAAIDMARRLDPDNPDVIFCTGVHFYYALRDYPHALEQFERITRQWPEDFYGYFMTGLVQRRQGRWLESLANLRRAAELDRGSAEHPRNLMISLVAMRRYPEAIAEQERRVRLLPESLRESFEVARLKFMASGSTQEGDDLLAGPIAGRAAPAVAVGYRKLWAAMKGDLATVTRLNLELPEAWAPGLAAQGDVAGARARVEKFPAELRARLINEPQNAGVLSQLAMIEALLGRKAEALAAAQQARTILPEAVDALSARGPRFAEAFVLAWTGDKTAACAALQQMLATGGSYGVQVLRSGPWFAPLKGDPRFEALLSDPKNSAPLF